MTCKEMRAQQLEALKDGIDEVVYCIDILNYGSFTVNETLTFETLEEAKAQYDNLVKPRGPYYPGFLRKYAKVTF